MILPSAWLSPHLPGFSFTAWVIGTRSTNTLFKCWEVENFLICQAKKKKNLPFSFCFFSRQEKAAFGALQMQMCEDFGSDNWGTERLLLIGKTHSPGPLHSTSSIFFFWV